MTLVDIFILGSACFWLGLFANPLRDAWNNAYYDEEGYPIDRRSPPVVALEHEHNQGKRERPANGPLVHTEEV